MCENHCGSLETLVLQLNSMKSITKLPCSQPVCWCLLLLRAHPCSTYAKKACFQSPLRLHTCIWKISKIQPLQCIRTVWMDPNVKAWFPILWVTTQNWVTKSFPLGRSTSSETNKVWSYNWYKLDENGQLQDYAHTRKCGRISSWYKCKLLGIEILATVKSTTSFSVLFRWMT